MEIRFRTVPSALVCLGCGNSVLGWMALTGVFITVLEARGPRAVPAWAMPVRAPFWAVGC